jgi:hypothetical protein
MAKLNDDQPWLLAKVKERKGKEREKERVRIRVRIKGRKEIIAKELMECVEHGRNTGHVLEVATLRVRISIPKPGTQHQLLRPSQRPRLVAHNTRQPNFLPWQQRRKQVKMQTKLNAHLERYHPPLKRSEDHALSDAQHLGAPLESTTEHPTQKVR